MKRNYKFVIYTDVVGWISQWRIWRILLISHLTENSITCHIRQIRQRWLLLFVNFWLIFDWLVTDRWMISDCLRIAVLVVVAVPGTVQPDISDHSFKTGGSFGADVDIFFWYGRNVLQFELLTKKNNKKMWISN